MNSMSFLRSRHWMQVQRVVGKIGSRKASSLDQLIFSEYEVKSPPKPWRLLASLCIVRMNRVSRPQSEIEIAYGNLQEQLEIENSVNNLYEMRTNKLEKQIAQRSAQKNLSDDEENKLRDISRTLVDIKVESF